MLLPDPATFDQLAARGTPENAVGWGEGVVADDGLDGNIEIECQGRDGPRPFAVSMLSLLNLMQFVVIAFLLVCVAMMVTLQLA